MADGARSRVTRTLPGARHLVIHELATLAAKSLSGGQSVQLEQWTMNNSERVWLLLPRLTLSLTAKEEHHAQ